MFTKKTPDRKKKRYVKRLLFIGVFVFAFLVFTGFAIYSVIMIQMHQRNYVSPLASIGFSLSQKQGLTSDTIERELRKQNIEFTAVGKDKDGNYAAKLKNGAVVTFSSQKDIMSQIASLQYILSHLTMEGKLFTRLDLRFEKPVIVLK